MTPTGELSRLIRSMFSAESIRQFVAEYFDFEDEIGFNEGLRSIAIEIAAFVWDAGIEEQFLDAVAEERSGRRDEIEAMRRILSDGRRAERSGEEWRLQALFAVDRADVAYEAAELTFGQSGSGWSVRPTAAEAEADAAVVELDTSPPVLQSLHGPTRDSATVDESTVGPGRIPSNLDHFGQILWGTIFGEDGANLAAALPKIQPQTGGRRIVLDLTRASGLASLPWECLRRPGRPPMGIDVKSTIIRLIDDDEFEPAKLKVDEQPLKLLIVTADNKRRNRFDFATEVARIGETANIVIPDPLIDATFETLFKALRDQRPHILHFIGHGSAQGIELAGNGSGQELLDASALANLVGNNLRTLRLVFLNSCRGAEEIHPHLFTSAASQMVQAGLPAAVAMQYPISNEAAIELSEIFYSYVALAEEIDAAITQARSYLHGMGYPEWVAPALYMRRWEGGLALVDTPVPAIAEEPPPMAAGEPAAVTPVTAPSEPAVEEPTAVPLAPAVEKPAAVAPAGAAVGEPAPAPAAPVGGRPAGPGPDDRVVVPLAGRRTPVMAILAVAALALGLIAFLSLSLFQIGDNVDEDQVASPSVTETVPTTTPTTSPTTTTTESGQDGSPDSIDGSEDVVIAELGPVDDDAVVVVQGLPGVTVDVYVDGELLVQDVNTGDVGRPLDLEPGSYQVDVYEAAVPVPNRSADRDDDPIVSNDVTIGGQPATVAIHLDSEGQPTVGVFEENASAVEAGRGRLEVRHLGAGAAVTLTVDGEVFNESIEPGGSATISPESGKLTIEASIDGSAAATTSLDMGDGGLIVVSMIESSTSPGDLDLVAQRYTGLSMIPRGVDAGNSGLKARSDVGARLAAQFAQRAVGPAVGSRQPPVALDTGAVVPVAVRLNGVQISAPIVAVGIDDDDRVAVPEPHLAGWFRHGSLPGAEGSAALVGHVDYHGRPAAFFDLEDVASGDQVEIEMNDGSVERFVVTRNAYYDKQHLPIGELFARTGPSRLQLITCGGEFDDELRSYRGNVVVTAIPLTLAESAWPLHGGVD